jgi:tight adherence protein B
MMDIIVVQQFEQQLPNMLKSWSNKLRDGYSVHQCFNLISHEAPPPVGNEIRALMEDMQSGLSWDEAAQRLLQRVPSEDLRLVAAAASVQREHGGNLADVLDLMNDVIQKRKLL